MMSFRERGVRRGICCSDCDTKSGSLGRPRRPRDDNSGTVTSKLQAKPLLQTDSLLAAMGYRLSGRGYLDLRPCTIANDFFTCSSGERPSSFDDNVVTILPSLPMTNVVRSIKSWSIATPRTSAWPGFTAVLFRLYEEEMSPFASEATGNFPAQYSGSAEN